MLPIYSLSNILFFLIFYHTLDLLTIFNLSIGLLHAFLPMEKYNEILCKVFLFLIYFYRFQMLLVIHNYYLNRWIIFLLILSIFTKMTAQQAPQLRAHFKLKSRTRFPVAENEIEENRSGDNFSSLLILHTFILI